MDSGIIVWLICLIPVITTIGFYVWKPHEFVWWELVLPIAATILITFITKFITDEINVSHDEVWNSNTIEIFESEPWNEWVYQTCEDCSTDSNGNTTCTSYDCSYQDDHGPRWYGETDIGETFYMSEHSYDSILSVWGKFKTSIKSRSNHSSNSRASSSRGTKFEGTRVGRTSQVYKSVWNKAESSRIPYSSRHKYENRIQASDVTVFDIKVITPKEADTLGLFEYIYPKNNGLNFPTILSKVKLPDSVQNKFQKLNGKFGPTNRMRLWVLVYENAPPVIGRYQENYWVKGNFNEFVICISVDKSKKIQWSHVFSWTLEAQLPVDARFAVTELGTLDKKGWDNLYKWLDGNLGRYDKRSHDEFSYLTVNPPAWAIILNIILTLIISFGFNYWVTHNEIYDKNHK